MNATSNDWFIYLQKGNTKTFDFDEYSFACESITEFLNVFFKNRIRKELPHTLPNDVPWSYAFDLLETKYNSRNWCSDGGFYKSSEATGESIFRQCQTGWVGGAMNTLPGLFIGNQESVKKAEVRLILCLIRSSIRQDFCMVFIATAGCTAIVLRTSETQMFP